jgi:hypothetical protein
LDEGFDSDFAAIVLCVVPNVKTLALRHKFHDMFHYIDWPGLVPGQRRLVPNIYYDDLLKSQELSTKLIKDLALVTQVHTNSFPPVRILQLPKLGTLELRLFDNHGSWDLPNTMTYKPLDPMLYSVLTRLFVYLYISALCSSNGGIYDHLKKTIKDLLSLTSLSLYSRNVFIDRADGSPYQLRAGSYAHVTSTLEHISSKRLILLIEEAGAELKTFENKPFLDGLRPITTFALLPELQSLAASQEAFCSYHKDYEAIDTCDLPTTIERIGITNSTDEINEYITHVLDHQRDWRKLSLIRLGLSGFNQLFDRGESIWMEATTRKPSCRWSWKSMTRFCSGPEAKLYV